eukprot:7377148-Prymnesium_polylepis.1
MRRRAAPRRPTRDAPRAGPTHACALWRSLPLAAACAAPRRPRGHRLQYSAAVDVWACGCARAASHGRPATAAHHEVARAAYRAGGATAPATRGGRLPPHQSISTRQPALSVPRRRLVHGLSARVGAVSSPQLETAAAPTPHAALTPALPSAVGAASWRRCDRPH